MAMSGMAELVVRRPSGLPIGGYDIERLRMSETERHLCCNRWSELKLFMVGLTLLPIVDP